MSLAKLKPGDRVVLTEWERTGDAIVEKVGRKWIVLAGRNGQFCIESGGDKVWGSTRRIRTHEQVAEDRRAHEAREALRVLGIRAYGIPREKLVAVLEAVRPILGGDQ